MGFVMLAVQAFFIYRFAKVFVTILRPFLLYFVYPKLGWLTDLTPYKNSWIIVTGCTDGIGKAYVLELAKRGCRKFLLIGRNQNKLNVVSEILVTEHGAETAMVVHDFENTDYSLVAEKLGELDEIGILVNNVGIAPEQLERLHEHTPGLAAKIVNVNILSTVRMCELVLPRMVKQKKGILVNVSSVLGWRPFPFLSTYSASKGCVSFLSECLQREYKGTGIKIQCIIPMLVATKMTKYSTANLFVVTPEQYAREAVQVIGARHLTMGCASHDVQAALLQIVPFWISKFLLTPLINYERRRLEKEKKM